MQVHFARRLIAGAALVAGVMLLSPASAEAQKLGYVVQGNYGDDVDFGVGAGVGFGTGWSASGAAIRGEATFDYFFPDGFDYWEINANLFLDIRSLQGLYVGGGLNYANISSDIECSICEQFGFDIDTGSSSEVGLNAIGGFNFNGSNGPFVQAKIELGGGEQFVITGGFRF
jgi:hypothetical protein